jgi:hypothetical protein
MYVIIDPKGIDDAILKNRTFHRLDLCLSSGETMGGTTSVISVRKS